MKLLLVLIFAVNLYANYVEEIVKVDTFKDSLEGTLSVVKNKKQNNSVVALIIAGSGPTNRDGNNSVMQNNSLKMLSQSLNTHGISTLRYDKRGVGKSLNAYLNEPELRFEHYVDDVVSWIKFLKQDERFSKIIVIGHSEGSLLGMIASNEIEVDKYISLAGMGRNASDVLLEQFESQPKYIYDKTKSIIEQLKKGNLVNDIPYYLQALLRSTIQPYTISLFQYEPTIEIKKLKIPVLIVQGNRDIQVTVKDAKLLHQANSNSKLKIIEEMNHIFKNSSSNRNENLQTYYNPNLEINKQLIVELVSFIKN